MRSLVTNALFRGAYRPRNRPVYAARYLSTSRFSNDAKGNANIAAAFPNMIPEQEFVTETFRQLSPLGFKKSNTIPCVGLCRDELTSPLLDIIDSTWRESEIVSKSNTFIMSSLAGMLFLGDTGITAAIDHAPHDEKGIERFVFYSFPHIGFNEKGEVGKLKRFGLPEDSACCGALIGFHNELHQGFLKMETNLNDVEQTLLKQRLIKNINIKDKIPDLVSLTKLAHTTVLSDLEGLIARNLDRRPRICEYPLVFFGAIFCPIITLPVKSLYLCGFLLQ
eukprot:Phypoly_transcript_08510.p1 GENE.Phypoly_transcript_08510~~Phypoly_transcript_08510.p1  ORF type:complete len:279 (+),score=14.84 Phypoly_transcript_08510:389-1225(+)